MPRDLTTYSTGSVWDFMSEVERALDDVWRPQARGKMMATFTPAVDVHETDDAYLLSLDVPGIPQNDIKIAAQDGRLTISGERSHVDTSGDKFFKRVERNFGRFERSFQLPKDVNEGKIQARYDNGVLEVMLPKAEVSKPRPIQIEAEKGGLFSRILKGKNVNSNSQSTESQEKQASTAPEKH
jgi:HSP20 family protein